MKQAATHPLILVASTSVTIASLFAIAHFTGTLPGHSDAAMALTATGMPATESRTTPAPAKPVAASATPPANAAPRARPTPVERPVQKQPEVIRVRDSVQEVPAQYRDWRVEDERPYTRNNQNDNGIDVISANPPLADQRATCRDCGTVESVREISTPAEGSGLGAIAGGVLGGLLGNQVGGGNGKKAATVIAAIGGAYAGHQVEKNVRAEKQYEVTVRTDDGNRRTYMLDSASRWQQGDRVRMSNGNLLPM
jgi:outer membrane lipoprotein SlyB